MQKETADWYVRIFYGGTRKWVALATPNKDVAARKAATFYENLLKGGWSTASENHAGGRAKVKKQQQWGI